MPKEEAARDLGCEKANAANRNMLRKKMWMLKEVKEVLRRFVLSNRSPAEAERSSD